jgi:hypothetical protein
MPQLWSVVAVVSVLPILGCGGARKCVPGQTTTCFCPGGSLGAQSCEHDGTYAPCNCEEPASDDKGPPPTPSSDGSRA